MNNGWKPESSDESRYDKNWTAVWRQITPKYCSGCTSLMALSRFPASPFSCVCIDLVSIIILPTDPELYLYSSIYTIHAYTRLSYFPFLILTLWLFLFLHLLILPKLYFYFSGTDLSSNIFCLTDWGYSIWFSVCLLLQLQQNSFSLHSPSPAPSAPPLSSPVKRGVSLSRSSPGWRTGRFWSPGGTSNSETTTGKQKNKKINFNHIQIYSYIHKCSQRHRAL